MTLDTLKYQLELPLRGGEFQLDLPLALDEIAPPDASETLDFDPEPIIDLLSWFSRPRPA